MKTIAFTRVRGPFGWLSNMSPHPIEYMHFTYPTAEHLFQCWRFVGPSRRWPGAADDGNPCGYATAVRAIRMQKSPMAAKQYARDVSNLAVVIPRSERDVLQMSATLLLKFAQHPRLLAELMATENAQLVENCSYRPTESGLFWGAQRTGDGWFGENTLGTLLEGVRTVAQKLGTSFVGSVMGSVVGDQLDLLLEGVRASTVSADRSS